jgi:putative copper export protein
VASDLVLTGLVRWTGLVSLAALLGGVVLAVAVLPSGVTMLRRRLAAWSRASVGLLLLTGVGELLLRTRTMTGGDLASALGASPVVLRDTHFGAVWTVRAGALVVLLGLIGRSSRAAWTAACTVALAVALTTSLVGHAADRGDVSLPVLIDWLHVAAAATWTGGLFCLTVLVLPAAARWPRDQQATLVRRFSTIAAASLGVVVASGMYNACGQVDSLHALATTRYGRILVAKIALVAAMASLGAANRFAVIPALGDHTIEHGATARLARYVAWEAALALMIFGCTAMLTESTPPRHAAHARVDD